jgi:transcriptional regulator with XRE-family HTH domain
MALFFDADWFDAQLTVRALSRADVAHALGLNAEQIAELWKDQRELSVRDVRALAALLGASVQEIAARAGVSTPVPADPPIDTAAALVELSERLARVERGLLELKALLLDLRDRPQ